MKDISGERYFVVYRFDGYKQLDPSRPEINNFITIKEVLPSEEDARREVERLGELNRGKRARYHYKQAVRDAAGRAIVAAPDGE